MRKSAIITIILLVLLAAGGGTGYYFYDKHQKQVAADSIARRDSIHRAREAELARWRAIEQARRDSAAAYESTHAPLVIMKRMEELLKSDILNHNQVGGNNWTERMNILQEQCKNVIAYARHPADSVYRLFSFKGMMGGDSIRIHGDSIMHAYNITPDSAYVDVHFDLGEKYPEGQNVSFKLKFIGGEWLLDDFTFQYSDGESYTESKEMEWFIDTYGRYEATDPDEEIKMEEKKAEPKKQDPPKAEQKKQDAKKPEPPKAEPKKQEQKKAEPKKQDTKKPEPPKAEPKKQEQKKAEPKKQDAKKPEPKKQVQKKAEPKKQETKKK